MMPTERKRTRLSPEQEVEFRKQFAKISAANGTDPDPDSPFHKYDARGAFLAGKAPDGETPGQHWPSQFKDEDHPNRFVRAGSPGNEDLRVGGGMLDTMKEKPVSKNRQFQIGREKIMLALKERYGARR